jgi:hypothetical protein
MPNKLAMVLGAIGVAALALPSFSLPSSAAPTPVVAVAKIDLGPGPAKLDALLAKFDAMKAGTERDALALAIDRFAGQRYATVSRLYWYTDFEEAKAAAKRQRQPILHLRMLGRLDEDLSCANSRFFRATLYANAETSKFLRDNFVLYWSSERPVPRVTIELGDGRKLVRTTTGNSAHYVMDERGNVLDVLPGLYAPVVFRQQLAKSLELATAVRGVDDKKLLADVLAFQQAEAHRAEVQFAALAGTDFVRRRGRLIDVSEIGTPAIVTAQRATYAKYIAEVPDLAKIGIDAGAIEPTDLGQWATIGQKVWNIGLVDPAQVKGQRLRRAGEETPRLLLDDRSVALVTKLREGGPATDMPRTIARLEQAILADSASNEFRIRQTIRRGIVAQSTLDFDKLNDWIYAQVFATPKSDPWLGLLENTDFTGLPADGVVVP